LFFINSEKRRFKRALNVLVTHKTTFVYPRWLTRICIRIGIVVFDRYLEDCLCLQKRITMKPSNDDKNHLHTYLCCTMRINISLSQNCNASSPFFVRFLAWFVDQKIQFFFLRKSKMMSWIYIVLVWSNDECHAFLIKLNFVCNCEINWLDSDYHEMNDL
jgi:hypothetical protein